MDGYVTVTFDPVKGLESIRASLLGILLKWWDTNDRRDRSLISK